MEGERYEAYQAWERRQMSDPRFASARMLIDDVRSHGEILAETWDRFDVEELTWAAEILDAPNSHIDRFQFDGQDVVVKESDGVNGRLTLRQIYQNGLDVTRQDVLDEPGLVFQQRRDELFMEFYEAIEEMMQGQTDYDTIHMVSACPVSTELSNDPVEAARLMRMRHYDPERGKSFDYTARRLPSGELELSATTLDNSNLAAHAKVLQEYGYDNVSFALLTSQEYGSFLSCDNTTDRPIEVVIAERVAVYDQEMRAQTGVEHRFGRTDNIVNAQEFLREHCGEYRAGYKAYNELLAKHLGGGELSPHLRNYLMRCLDGQERVGKSVLSQDAIDRLRAQLVGGKVTMDMAMSCRELLVYDHHATLTHLFREYNATGQVPQLEYSSGDDFMDAYADSASSNGADAAANGESFAGCETETSVSSLSSAAQEAAASGMSLEQVLRRREEEAAHCLNIQMYGFTIRRGVHCPFCRQKVDARDTQTAIECLSDECGTILDKATGKTRVRERLAPAAAKLEDDRSNIVPLQSAKLHSGQYYTVGQREYRREQHTVVGGAVVVYIDSSGQRITGALAEELEAVIISQISAETPAA